MKKSLVAVGVIVALGVVWTGASWYMGSKIESRLQEETKRANVQLAQLTQNSDLGANITLELRDYKKGVFTSTATYALAVKNEDKKEEVIFNSNVSHGPFPLSDLAKFNLAPKLAAVDSTLENNETTKELFTLTKEKSLVNLHTSIGFDGAASAELVINPLDFEKEGSKVKTKPIIVAFTSDKDAANISMNFKSDEIVATNNGDEAFTIKNMSGEVTGSKVSGDQYLFNNQTLTVGEVDYKDKEPASNLVLKDLTVSTKSQIKDKLFSAAQSYSFNSLNVGGLEFGTGKVAYSIDKADIDAMLLLTKVYNNSLLPWNKYQTNNDAVIEQALRDVVEKGLVFKIDEASLTNKSGTSKLTFNLDLNAFKIDDLNQLESPAELFAKLFSNIALNVDVSLPMAGEFRNTTQYLDAARYQEKALTDADKAEIQKETATEIEKMKTELQQNINQKSQEEKDALPLMTLSSDAKNLNLSLNYAADKFTMNGKTYGFDEFMEVTQAPQMLGLIGMLMGAGAASYGDYDDSDAIEVEPYSEEEMTEDPAIIDEPEIVIPEQPSH